MEIHGIPILSDFTVHSDRHKNLLDQVKCLLINMIMSSDENIAFKVYENFNEYKDLEVET